MPKKNGFTNLIKAVEIYNGTVFCSLPKSQFATEKLTPAYLFTQNPTELLKKFVKFRTEQSNKRTTRQMGRRGVNIESTRRKFEVGDIVRFNTETETVFGKVMSKNAEHFYNVNKIGDNKTFLIHAKELSGIEINGELLEMLMN